MLLSDEREELDNACNCMHMHLSHNRSTEAKLRYLNLQILLSTNSIWKGWNIIPKDIIQGAIALMTDMETDTETDIETDMETEMNTGMTIGIDPVIIMAKIESKNDMK